ncbi:MAG: hypothetical protein R3304_02700 [Longimicrobiales bacterium]|nr:hypothetical protein [Longimicrobiales bacterium]
MMAACSLGSRPLAAQAPEVLAGACVEAGGAADDCLAGATAGYSFLGHATLLSGLGSPVPGTASNLGTRAGGGPRWAFFGHLSASSWGLPDLREPLTESAEWVPSFQGGVAAGLFDGVRLMPTVGGFLATDLFVDVALHLPSSSRGIEGSVRSFSAGARLGIFREGFTVPGVSVSVARRFFGETTYGDPLAGDVAGVTVDPSATSIRVAASKDLFAVEVLAGFGWDDFSADARLSTSDGPLAPGSAAARGSISGSRRLYFASASMTFSLVLALTVEGGWAEGLSPVPGYAAEHDPSRGTGFASISARLVL